MLGEIFQCGYCGEYSKKWRETCKMCGSESLTPVLYEEAREWGRKEASGNRDESLLE